MTATKPRRVILPGGLRADQPGASSVAEGALYFVTDEGVLERSDGTNWDPYSGAGASHNHTSSPGDGGVLTNDEHDGFADWTGSSVPATPASGHARFFAASAGGHTAPSWIDEAGFVIRMTRDLTLLIRNTSGSTIARGKAVRFTGSTGVVPTIGLADADVFDSGRPRAAVGLTLESLANNAYGVILLSGLIADIDTSAFVEGATVFLSTTAGSLTATAPSTAGCFVQPVGQVTRAHATAGSIELDFEVPATTLLANLTVGRVPFVGTGPVLVDDSTFVFDATNDVLRVPTIVGGTGTTDDLHLRATTGVGTTNARIFLDVGNNGAIPAVEIKPDAGGNFGQMGVGTSGNFTVDCPLAVFGTGADFGYLIKCRPAGGTPNSYIQMQTASGNANASGGFSFNQLQNGVEWRMDVLGNAANMMRWVAINSSGAITNYVLWAGPLSMNVLLASASTKEVTTGTRCLVVEKGTAPTACASDTAALFTKDDAAGVTQLCGINESGTITQLTGVVPAASVGKSGTQSLSDSTFTAVDFDTEAYDVGSCHSTSSNTSRLVVPTAGDGTYLVVGTIEYASNTTGIRLARLRKNGSGGLTSVVVNPVVGDATAVQVTTVVPLVATDYIELVGYQTSGGALNVGFNSNLTWSKL